MSKGGVVSSRISQFEELCVPINKANISFKKNGSKYNDFNNNYEKNFNGNEYENMNQSSPMKRHEEPIVQPEMRKTDERQYGVLQNVTVTRCEETVVIKNLWNPIITTNLDVGSCYLVEITGDVTSLVPGERDIVLETRLRTEPPQGNTSFSEVSTIKLCGIAYGRLTQFSIRRYLELDNNGSNNIQLIGDVRSQSENVNIKNIFVSCTPMQIK